MVALRLPDSPTPGHGEARRTLERKETTHRQEKWIGQVLQHVLVVVCESGSYLIRDRRRTVTDSEKSPASFSLKLARSVLCCFVIIYIFFRANVA